MLNISAFSSVISCCDIFRGSNLNDIEVTLFLDRRQPIKCDESDVMAQLTPVDRGGAILLLPGRHLVALLVLTTGRVLVARDFLAIHFARAPSAFLEYFSPVSEPFYRKYSSEEWRTEKTTFTRRNLPNKPNDMTVYNILSNGIAYAVYTLNQSYHELFVISYPRQFVSWSIRTLDNSYHGQFLYID